MEELEKIKRLKNLYKLEQELESNERKYHNRYQYVLENLKRIRKEIRNLESIIYGKTLKRKERW